MGELSYCWIKFGADTCGETIQCLACRRKDQLATATDRIRELEAALAPFADPLNWAWWDELRPAVKNGVWAWNASGSASFTEASLDEIIGGAAAVLKGAPAAPAPKCANGGTCEGTGRVFIFPGDSVRGKPCPACGSVTP